jgi:very-short-patch-repair endonuclease
MGKLKSPLGKALFHERNNEDHAFDLAFERVDSYIDNAPLTRDSEDVQEAFTLTLRTLSRVYVEDVYHSLFSTFRACGSQIESMLLSALLTYAAASSVKLKVITNRVTYMLNRQTGNDQELVIILQHVIGDYRVDFLLELNEIVPDFNKEIMTRDGQKIPGSCTGNAKVLVECDGHDFHEKTKEQAEKDKKRDRILQSAGFHIFRFTGSEIWRNPITCAKEIFDYLEEKVWES